MMGKTKWLLAATLLCLAMVGCSAGASPDGAMSVEPEGMPDDAVKVEQIDYEVVSGIEDGNRRAMFHYTNGSDYTVVEVSLRLTVPDDVTDDEIESTFEDLVSEDILTADEIREMGMTCESTYAVDPGETSGDRAPLVGLWYVTGVDQYELMEPDMALIRFLADGKLYEEYYDYRTGAYNLSDDVIDAGQWGSGDLCEAVPRPEGALVTDVRDGETQFSFEVISMTPTDFATYVAACRDAGYTKGIAETDTTFYADSADGMYHVDLLYWKENGRLSGYVSHADDE